VPGDGERIATLEANVGEIRVDLAELVAEERRTRKRLHDLEGITGALVNLQKERRRDEQRRERKYTRRLNLLLVLASFAAVASPIVVALLHHQ